MNFSSYSDGQASSIELKPDADYPLNIYLDCSPEGWSLGGESFDYAAVTCGPVCQSPCNAGGECISPFMCKCPDGYAGEYCQHTVAGGCYALLDYYDMQSLFVPA